MDGRVREIRGYYYDAEKNKYFKIQASGAGPASAAYTPSDVKRRKLHDERLKAEATRLEQEKGRIQRSKILSEPLAGGFLTREPAQFLQNASSIYASGLLEQGSLPAEPFCPDGDPCFSIDRQLGLGSSIVDFRLAYDNTISTVRANVDKSIQTESNEICDLSRPNQPGVSRASWKNDVFHNKGPCTSLSTNESSDHHLMTWLGGTPYSGIAIVPSIRALEFNRYAEGPNILGGPGTLQGKEVNIYSSAPAPPASSLLFVIGTSHGIIGIEKQDYKTYSLTPRPSACEGSPTDVFALEFLADNHSVLLSGGRNGLLHITDLRVPKFGSNGDFLAHASAITHIKQLDAHRILVAGLNSNMSQYDLRFRKVDTFDRQDAAVRHRKARRGIMSSQPTRPILHYDGYYNQAVIHIGLDVDLETGVVAAAQQCDDSHPGPAVQLFSLHGGNRLPSPDLGRLAQRSGRRPIPCLKFLDDGDGPMKNLYVSCNGIRKFKWACKDDDGEY